MHFTLCCLNMTFCWLNKVYWYMYCMVFINVLYLPVISLLSSKPTISLREHFSVWLVCVYTCITVIESWFYFGLFWPLKYEVPKLNTPKYVTLQKLIAKIEHFLNIFLYSYSLIWYMYLFTQQLYIINKTDKTLITCLLIFLFSIGNCHFNDIWHFVDWIKCYTYCKSEKFCHGFILAYFGPLNTKCQN
jgi:hypothetical protein